MDNMPTYEQIRQAMETLLRKSRRSKRALAEAVRNCCEYRPMRAPFHIGAHKLEWINAECLVRGGRVHSREVLHFRQVLLLDDHLVDEKSVEVSLPDGADNHWESLMRGPTNGWYHRGAWEEYRDFGGGDADEPRPMRRCDFDALRGVARVLSEPAARWLAEKMRRSDAERSEADTLTAALRSSGQAD